MLTMVFMAFIALIFVGNKAIDDMARYTIYAITFFAVLALIFITNRNFARAFSGILFFFKPIEEKLKRAYDGVHKYKHHKILISQSFFISIISQILFFLSLGVIALSIGSRITLMDLLLRMPIISILSLLPSINGLGLRESSTVIFFGPLIGKGNAFAVSILWLVVLLMTSLIGGIVYGMSPQFRVKLKEVE